MNTEPQFVYIAIYEHCSGHDVSVYQSEESAWKWANEIAEEYWEDFYEDPKPTENIGAAYFNGMPEAGGSEWFTIERRQVEP